MAWLMLFVALGVTLAFAFTARPDLRARVYEAALPFLPWVVCGLAAIVAGLLAETGAASVVVGGVLLVLMAWLHEFAFLMRQGDDAFPGRFDKLIWAFLMIVLPPVGVLAFWSYRRAHWPLAKPSPASIAHELS